MLTSILYWSIKWLIQSLTDINIRVPAQLYYARIGLLLLQLGLNISLNSKTREVLGYSIISS